MTLADISFTPSGHSFTLKVASNQSVATSPCLYPCYISSEYHAEDTFRLFYTVLNNAGTLTDMALSTGSLDILRPQFNSVAQAQSDSKLCSDPDCSAELRVCTNYAGSTAYSTGTLGNFAYGDFTLFDLFAQDGGSAAWDPQATVSFTLSQDSASPTTVPEPATLSLLSVRAAMWTRRRRQRRP